MISEGYFGRISIFISASFPSHKNILCGYQKPLSSMVRRINPFLFMRPVFQLLSQFTLRKSKETRRPSPTPFPCAVQFERVEKDINKVSCPP